LKGGNAEFALQNVAQGHHDHEINDVRELRSGQNEYEQRFTKLH
jgi:hypothetical protein